MVENGVESFITYSAGQIRAFLDAYLNDQLPAKLLSESSAEIDKLNQHSRGGYVENIAGSQFNEL